MKSFSSEVSKIKDCRQDMIQANRFERFGPASVFMTVISFLTLLPVLISRDYPFPLGLVMLVLCLPIVIHFQEQAANKKLSILAARIKELEKKAEDGGGQPAARPESE